MAFAFPFGITRCSQIQFTFGCERVRNWNLLISLLFIPLLPRRRPDPPPMELTGLGGGGDRRGAARLGAEGTGTAPPDSGAEEGGAGLGGGGEQRGRDRRGGAGLGAEGSNADGTAAVPAMRRSPPRSPAAPAAASPSWPWILQGRRERKLGRRQGRRRVAAGRGDGGGDGASFSSRGRMRELRAECLAILRVKPLNWGDVSVVEVNAARYLFPIPFFNSLGIQTAALETANSNS